MAIDHEKIDRRLINLVEKMLTMTEQSIETIEKQTEELRKEDPFIIVPTDDMIKIANALQKIMDLKSKL
jgi:hypothetical protein